MSNSREVSAYQDHGTAHVHDLRSAPGGVGATEIEMFVAVAEKRRPQLIWVAQRITKDRDIAEDIVQESLLRAFRSLSEFRGESQVSTWLRVIVQNTALEWLRSRRGRVHLPLELARADEDEPLVLQLADSHPDPEQCCQRSEMQALVHTEIARLGTLCRQAIQMCSIEELPMREAACSMNTTVISLKSRVFRGKQLLKRGVCQRLGGEEHVWVP